MFCPKCGNADQQSDTFCRKCGTFLPDFDKVKKKEISPEEHLNANCVLVLMSAVVSLTLSILLYAFFLGKEDTPILIYITAGFLTVMFFWQAQTFWRTVLLKRQLKKRNPQPTAENAADESNPPVKAVKTRELLNEADLKDAVPASVVENTTRKLGTKIKRESSQTQ
ncbi:hypothetical protein BH10ACI1_BH10ACI1_21370 [soil metagenome]